MHVISPKNMHRSTVLSCKRRHNSHLVPPWHAYSDDTILSIFPWMMCTTYDVCENVKTNDTSHMCMSHFLHIMSHPVRYYCPTSSSVGSQKIFANLLSCVFLVMTMCMRFFFMCYTAKVAFLQPLTVTWILCVQNHISTSKKKKKPPVSRHVNQ